MSNRSLIIGVLITLAIGAAAWLITRSGSEVDPTVSSVESSETAEHESRPDSAQVEQSAVGHLPDSVTVLQAGDRAVDFTLESLDGESFTLSEHRGDVVVVNFWATWCQPCHEEMPALDMVHDALGDRDVRIVGVSLDEEGRDAVAEFHAAYPVQFPLLLDGLDVAEAYGAHFVVPTTYIVDRAGQIAERIEGAVTREELLGRLAAVD